MGMQIDVQYVDKEGCRRYHEFRCHRRSQRQNDVSTANRATQARQNKCLTADCASQSQQIKICHTSTSVCTVSELLVIDGTCSPICRESLSTSSQDCQAGYLHQCLQTDADTDADEQPSYSFFLNILWILLITFVLYWLFSKHAACNEQESELIEPESLQLQNRKFHSAPVIVEAFYKCQDLRFSLSVFSLNGDDSVCSNFETQRNTVTNDQKQKALLLDEVHMGFLKRTMIDRSPCEMTEEDFSSMQSGLSALGSNIYISIQLLAFKSPSEMFQNMNPYTKNPEVIISLLSLDSTCKKLNWNLAASYIPKRNIHIREVLILPPNIQESSAPSPSIFSILGSLFPDFHHSTCPTSLCSHTTKEIKVLNYDVTVLYSVLLCYY